MPPSFPNHNFGQSADWVVCSGRLLHREISSLAPIVDGTVLLGVEAPRVAVHPFGTDGPYPVEKAYRECIVSCLRSVQYVAPVSISASRCCSVVKVPGFALPTNAILLARGSGERETG